VVEIACPFCGEDDFDMYGLQFHLQVGHCEVFGRVPTPEPNTIILCAVCRCCPLYWEDCPALTTDHLKTRPPSLDVFCIVVTLVGSS